MPSTPLTCCSMGAATVSATTWALAPGYAAETSTVGGAISGYWAIGKVNSAMPPPKVMTMDRTEAKMGRLMKNLENIPSFFHSRRPEDFKTRRHGDKENHPLLLLDNPRLWVVNHGHDHSENLLINLVELHGGFTL